MQLRNNPKCTKILQRSNGVDWVCPLRKIPTWLCGTNFCISAPVPYVFHQVSCSYETIPNVPKYYEIHRNISFGSNGVDQCIRCEKLQCDFVAGTFALLAPVHPVLHRVSSSYESFQNAPKHYETHQNMSLGSNGVDRMRCCEKFLMRFHSKNLSINCTSSTYFAPSFV